MNAALGKSKITDVALLLVVCCGLYFVRLGSFGVLEGGESYYPAACREMLNANEWIVPQLNYQLYFSKPILTFWFIESAYKLLGVNEFAGRIWSALLSTALVFVCYFTTKALSSARAGLLAGLMLASSPLMVATCRRSSIDVFFSVFFGMALCAAMMVLFAKRKNWWVILYSALALAALSKGPAAIVLFGGGLAGYLIFQKSSVRDVIWFCKEIWLLPGIALFLAIILPWCFAVSSATNGLFLKVFFLYENLSRFQGNTNSGKHPHWWAYIPALLYGALPWSFYLPAPVIDSFTLLKEKFFTRKAQDEQTDKLDATKNGVRLFCLANLAVTVVFFSISRTQFDRYIMPIWCPLVMMIALSFEEWLQEPSKDALIAKFQKIVSPMLAGLGTIALIGSVVAVVVLKELQPWMRVVAPLGALVLAGGWVNQYLQYQKKEYAKSLMTLAISTCVSYSIVTPVLFEYWYQRTYQGVHELVKSVADTDADVAQYKEFMPSLLYYRKGPVFFFYHLHQMLPKDNPKFSEPQPPPAMPGQPRIAAGQPQDKRLFILVQKNHEPDIVAAASAYKLKLKDRKGEWSLWETSDFVFDKPPTLETAFRRLDWKDSMTDRFGFGPLTVPYSGGDKVWIR